VLLVATLSIALQQTMVAPALPAIQDELGTTTTAVSFVFTAFLLTASVATPIVGRLGDMFGKERMLVSSLVVFGAGSVVCAMSHSIETLMAGRAVQGTAAAVFPLALGIIRDEFPPERVAIGIGVISATFGIGGGVGLVVSGVIVDNLHYEWLFWLALPLILVAIVATRLWVPESPVRSPARIDWLGAGLLSGALVALLLGVSQANAWGWGSARTLALFGTAAVLAVVWIVVESRRRDPLVDMGLMRDPAVLATNLAALLVGFGMFGSFILIPQLVQLPESTGFGLGGQRDPGGAVPAAGLVRHAVRRAARRLARRPGGRQAAAADRHRRRGGDVRRARDRAQPRRHLRVHHPDGPRDRVLVRLDGEPRGRGGASAPDGRGHRHQYDHAHDRRLGRRVRRGEHRRGPRGGRQWASRRVRFTLAFAVSAVGVALAFAATLAIPQRIVGGRLAAAGAVARR
jgi:MFS family permease